MERVLIVEEVFSIGKRGILVSPWLPLSAFNGKVLPSQIELRFSDGSTKTKAAEFNIPRHSPQPEEYSLVCYIKNILKEECPIGTEVWANLNNATI